MRKLVGQAPPYIFCLLEIKKKLIIDVDKYVEMSKNEQKFDRSRKIKTVA